MGWIAENRYYSVSEMENNADIIIAYYREIGYSDLTIASLLGNIEAESNLSPVRIEEQGGGGYGLIQWTPRSVLESHCNTIGASPYTSGDVQLEVIDKELGNTYGINEWYPTRTYINMYRTSGATNDMIGITANQYKSNSMNFNLDKLTILFMVGRLRPSQNPSVNHINTRKRLASYWLEYMGGTPPTPPTPPYPPAPLPPFESSRVRRGRRIVAFKKKQYLQ